MHGNVGWVNYTSYTSVDCEGRALSSLFNVKPPSLEHEDAKCLFISSSLFTDVVELRRKGSSGPHSRSDSVMSRTRASSLATDRSPFMVSRNSTCNSSTESIELSLSNEAMLSDYLFSPQCPRLRLSPVSVGSKHYAVMCFPQLTL